MGSRIGVGIVGCGFGAYHHGKTLAAEYDDRFKLIGFCDVNRQRLEQTCSSFNVRGYSDIDEMLADRNVELVIIATRPHTTHFPLAVKSLKAGRNVVVEKPMCITSGEAREMIKVRDETRRLLTVHQNRRWDMDYLDIRQVLERGTPRRGQMHKKLLSRRFRGSGLPLRHGEPSDRPDIETCWRVACKTWVLSHILTMNGTGRVSFPRGCFTEAV